MKRTTLSYKKSIVSKRGYVTNINEYRKGRERGESDAENKKPFGVSCAKLTKSYCIGYKLGWRSKITPARTKNFWRDYPYDDDV